MSILQQRLVRVAAAAVAVVALVALPTGAKASLITDPFTLTSAVISPPCANLCVDNDIVAAGVEFTATSMSNVSPFLSNPALPR